MSSSRRVMFFLLAVDKTRNTEHSGTSLNMKKFK